jgi:hypothetical protein
MKKETIESDILKLGLRGWLTAKIRRKGSDRFEELWAIPVRNLIVNAGLAQVALLLGDAAAAPFIAGNIGTGTTAPNVDQTALVTQVDSQTVAFSRETTTVANDTAVLISTHTAPAGGWAITEYGAFNSGSVMYNRVVFAAINLAETEQLQFTYKSQITRI